MTLKECELEIQRLQALSRDLRKQEIAEKQDSAKVHVGRCFIIDGKYVKIIGVPQTTWRLSGEPVFNEYQYPALFLGFADDDIDHVVPFYYDTLFFGREERGQTRNYSLEIAPYEFEAEYRRLLQKFEQDYIMLPPVNPLADLCKKEK